MAKKKEEDQKEKKQQLSPQELRRANYEASKKLGKIQREEDVREDFKKYFIKLRRKLNLNSQLEEVIWLHLKAIKMASQDKFDDGVRNFGYKV